MTATSSPLLERRDVAVLVPAAGLGLRLGGSAPKALRDLDGLSLLEHCCRGLTAASSVGLVVIAAPAQAVPAVAAQLPWARVVAGGATRQESVARALAEVPAEFEVVLVHDAARCLTPPELIEAVAAAVRSGHAAVIPVLPVVDTIKQIAPDGSVVGTVDRSQLGAVQTPQGFRRSVLVQAHAEIPDSHTDDAGLIERLGLPVHTIAGHPEALKITTPLDLLIASAILRERRARQDEEAGR
jgi:2-C-methyl-D-erythritol 4-phosphate cytidylyltransferase